MAIQADNHTKSTATITNAAMLRVNTAESSRARNDIHMSSVHESGKGMHHVSNGQSLPTSSVASSGINFSMFMKEVPLQSFTKRRMTADEAGPLTERANSSSHGNTFVPKK